MIYGRLEGYDRSGYGQFMGGSRLISLQTGIIAPSHDSFSENQDHKERFNYALLTWHANIQYSYCLK